MRTLSPAPSLPPAQPVPSTVTSLPYAAYSRECEPGAEQCLELVTSLYSAFDELYPVELLVYALRDLNPLVELQEMVEADYSIRYDWPWLSDEDYDALEAKCRKHLDLQGPHQELNQLICGLVVAQEPALLYPKKHYQQFA